MKLTPGLLLITRKYLKRKLNLSYFDDDTFIDGCDPNVEIIPFLNYLEIYDEKRFKIFKNLNSEEVLQKILCWLTEIRNSQIKFHEKNFLVARSYS